MECRIRSTGIWLLFNTKLNQSQKKSMYSSAAKLHKITTPETAVLTRSVEHFWSFELLGIIVFVVTCKPLHFLFPLFMFLLWLVHRTQTWMAFPCQRPQTRCSVRGPLRWNSGELNFHDPPRSSNLHHCRPCTFLPLFPSSTSLNYIKTSWTQPKPNPPRAKWAIHLVSCGGKGPREQLKWMNKAKIFFTKKKKNEEEKKNSLCLHPVRHQIHLSA